MIMIGYRKYLSQSEIGLYRVVSHFFWEEFLYFYIFLFIFIFSILLFSSLPVAIQIHPFQLCKSHIKSKSPIKSTPPAINNSFKTRPETKFCNFQSSSLAISICQTIHISNLKTNNITPNQND